MGAIVRATRLSRYRERRGQRQHARKQKQPSEIEIHGESGEDGICDRERAEDDHDDALEHVEPPVCLERVGDRALRLE